MGGGRKRIGIGSGWKGRGSRGHVSFRKGKLEREGTEPPRRGRSKSSTVPGENLLDQDPGGEAWGRNERLNHQGKPSVVWNREGACRTRHVVARRVVRLPPTGLEDVWNGVPHHNGRSHDASHRREVREGPSAKRKPAIEVKGCRESRLTNKPRTLYLDWYLVTRKMQVWRLVTCFSFIGGFSMRYLVKIMLLANHGVPLERSAYQYRTADYVYMHVFAGGCLLGISYLFPGLQLSFLGGPLLYVVLYVWSRNFSDSPVSIMGFLKLQGFYLPWAYLGIDMIMGMSPVESLLGIFVGHLYYFFGTLYPLRTGKNPLATPRWLTNMVENGPSVHQTQTRQTWQGRGRRLAD